MFVPSPFKLKKANKIAAVNTSWKKLENAHLKEFLHTQYIVYIQ